MTVDQGNRLRRAVVGFGAGASEVRTIVQVFETTNDGRRLVEDFYTTVKSSRKPGFGPMAGAGAAAGTAATSVAVSAGVGLATAHSQTVEGDAKNTRGRDRQGAQEVLRRAGLDRAVTRRVVATRRSRRSSLAPAAALAAALSPRGRRRPRRSRRRARQCGSRAPGRERSSVNGAAVLIYQPQIDKWDGNQFEARAAVAVRLARRAASRRSVSIWITARTDVDKERGLVTLHDIKVPRVSFPASPGRESGLPSHRAPARARGVSAPSPSTSSRQTSPSAGRRRRRPRRCPS